MEWKEQSVQLGPQVIQCRYRVVKDMVEVAWGDHRATGFLGVLRPEVVVRDVVRRTLATKARRTA